MNIAVTNLQRKIPVPVFKIRSAARKALYKLSPSLTLPARGREYLLELSIVFVGLKRMRRINKKYLGHDYATDVLTFDHGEIIVCPRTAAHNAKRHGNTVDQELILYVMHGLLHLAGYDDKTAEDKRRMREKERELM